MPGQALFIKLYYDLRTLQVGLFGWNQVSFIGVFPFHKEHQFARCVSCANDAFRDESAVESFFTIGFLLGGRFRVNGIIGFAFLRLVCGRFNIKKRCCVSTRDASNSHYVLITFSLLLAVFKRRNQFRAVQILLRFPSIIILRISLPLQIIFYLKVNVNYYKELGNMLSYSQLTFEFRVRFWRTFSTEYSSCCSESLLVLLIVLFTRRCFQKNKSFVDKASEICAKSIRNDFHKIFVNFMIKSMRLKQIS